MTVQEMDLCLNISTGPPQPVAASKSAVNRDVAAFLAPKAKGKPAEATSAASQAAKKRVKQKSLAAIVARKVKQSQVASGAQKKTVTWKLDEAAGKPEPAKESNQAGDVPAITFAKPTKENVGKTLFAKKRSVSELAGKKSLSGVFSKGSESRDDAAGFNLLPPTDGKEEVAAASKKPQLDEPDKPSFLAKKSPLKPREQRKELAARRQEGGKPGFHGKPAGKVSSLFGHNPEVPNIGQRFVKPINEPVFTGTTFADLDVHPYMISNLEQSFEITKMTTVQQKAIPQILSGKDVLVRSQTGSGKTLTYALPIVESLHKIRPKLTRSSGLQALVVVPTRELALQSYECFLKLVKPFTWIVPGYLTGGEKRKAEKARLRRGCNILVGTPGRLLDHIKHTAALKLNQVKCFVLDEADRMFDMGYEKDISGIVSTLKTSTPDQQTGYDPLQILRKQNSKKVFTDEEVDDLEASKEESLETDAQELDNSQTADKKQDYRSSSDNDSDDGEPFVKSSKTDKSKSAKSKKTIATGPATGPAAESNQENSDAPGNARRQTVLLSATLTSAVEKLAGLAMENPVFVDAARENLINSGGDQSEENEDLVVPQSVVQTYIVTPPKLRMVTLSAFIAGKCQSSGQHKILIFMATQDMIDYHTDMLSSVLGRPSDPDDEDSDPLVDVEFFKLHGSMTQKERTEVFKTFRAARSGVLLCTDVAARGLDLPKVDCVIQYTGPLSARDYVHRIGRTARAGSSGSATIFLTPPEIEFVRMLESRRIRIKQEDMNDTLGNLLGPLSPHSSTQTAAIRLQDEFERMVLENKSLREKACKAYVSWVRFYSSYPRDMREIFDRRQLHLGHYAKSFALREPPKRIGGIGKNLREKDAGERTHENRLHDEERSAGAASQRKRRQQDRTKEQGGRMGSASMLKRVRMLNTSEYGSGLEPLKKPKKS